MEYLAVSAKELINLEAVLKSEIERIKKHPEAKEKEWIKHLEVTEKLLKKITLKKMKVITESKE